MIKPLNAFITALVFSTLTAFTTAHSADKFVLDDFEGKANALYTKTGIYSKAPSDAKKGRTEKEKANGTASLFVGYKKQKDGFCGYYIHLKAGNNFFDGSKYTKLTFMVKGKKGGENFQIGLADKKWFELDDSVKSPDVTKFIPGGKITTEWQKVEVPLKEWVDIRSGDFDLKELGSVAFCFETSCFPDGQGTGVIYIDDISFE